MNSSSMLDTHPDNPKGVMIPHSPEVPPCRTDNEQFTTIIPVKWNSRPLPVLVSVTISVIFIQFKVGIFSRIHANFKRPPGVFGGLNLWAEGDNAAFPYINWNSI